MAAGDRRRRGAHAGHRLGRGRGRERVPRAPPRVAAAAARPRGDRDPARRLAGSRRRRPARGEPAHGTRRAGRGAGRAAGHRAHRVRTGGWAADGVPAAGGRTPAAGAAYPGRPRRAVRERADRPGRAAGAARRREHRRADRLAGRGDDRGAVPLRPRRPHRRTAPDRRGQPAHQPRQPRRGPGQGARRAAPGGHRVRPCRGRLRTRRRLARQPRPPGAGAGPRHPDRPRLPGLTAGRAAGTGRELSRTGCPGGELEAVRGPSGRDG